MSFEKQSDPNWEPIEALDHVFPNYGHLFGLLRGVRTEEARVTQQVYVVCCFLNVIWLKGEYQDFQLSAK